METKELEVNRELRAVRNYGIMVLLAFLALNATTLLSLSWFEGNDLRHELASISEQLPARSDTNAEQTINLPEDILSFHTSSREHTGFYNTEIVGKDYLAYANPDKSYILMKSRDSVNHEIQNFAYALLALFVGEVIVIIGWWSFIHNRVRQLFEIK
jgi:hypothetical protein